MLLDHYKIGDGTNKAADVATDAGQPRKAEANRKTNLEQMETNRKADLEHMATNRKANLDNLKMMMEEMLRANQDGLKEMTACNGVTETEPDPGMMQFIGEHQSPEERLQ
jgi:hypothetical protein